MARREPDGDTGVEVAIGRLRSLDRRLSDLEAYVAGKLPHTHAMDGVSGRAARVYLGSAQSISNATFTKVAVDSVTADPDGLFDSANNEINADRDGWWLVAFGVGYDGNSTGDRRFATVAHNGVQNAYNASPPTGARDANVSVTSLIKAVAGDTFSAQAFQDSGGSLGLITGSSRTWLSAAYLGSA